MKIFECPMGRFHPHGARYYMNDFDGRCAFCSDEANAPVVEMYRRRRAAAEFAARAALSEAAAHSARITREARIDREEPASPRSRYAPDFIRAQFEVPTSSPWPKPERKAGEIARWRSEQTTGYSRFDPFAGVHLPTPAELRKGLACYWDDENEMDVRMLRRQGSARCARFGVNPFTPEEELQ